MRKNTVARLCLHISRCCRGPMRIPLMSLYHIMTDCVTDKHGEFLSKSMALIFFRWPHFFLRQGPKGPSEKNPRMNTVLGTANQLCKCHDELKLWKKCYKQPKWNWVLIFTGSLMSHTVNLGCAYALVFQKWLWVALIGAGALNRVNTVIDALTLHHLLCFWRDLVRFYIQKDLSPQRELSHLSSLKITKA